MEQLPAGGTLLAFNAAVAVQAAKIRYDRGVFWGVQYDPELTLAQIAAALRRDAAMLIEDGPARTEADAAAQARMTY